MSDRIVLRGPADVVLAVPSLLGFQPEQSLVGLWLSEEDSSVICTVRLDLETPTAEMLRHVHRVAASTGSSRLLLIAYPESLTQWIDSTDEDRLLDLDRQLSTADVRITDALVVCEGRYWSMLCADPGCCPIGGQPVPDAVSPLTLDLIGAGHIAPAASRSEVVARYRTNRDPDLSPELLDTVSDGLPTCLGDRCDRALELVAEISLGPSRPVVRAEMAWLLQDVNVRDWVLTHLCTSDPDLAAIEALTQLALTAPESLRPRLAGAAAAALYASAGSSVGVWALIDHAEDDSLAGLVAASLDSCLPPTALQEVFATALPALENRIRADVPA